ncbi:putative Secreted ookinete protein [Balamuthia mandrillaris]
MSKHLLSINAAQRFLHESAQDAKMQLRTHTSMIYNESEMTSSGQFFVPQEHLAFGEWNLQRWNKIVQTYFGSIKNKTKEKDKETETEEEEEEKKEEEKEDNDEKEEDIQLWGLKKAAWQAQRCLINMTTDLMQVEDNGNAMELNYFAKEVYHQVKTFNSFLHITPIQFWQTTVTHINNEEHPLDLCGQSKEDFEDGVSTYLNVTKRVMQNHYNRHSTFKRSQEVLKILGAPEMKHLASHFQQASETHAQLLLQPHQQNQNSPFASRQMVVTRPVRTSTSDQEWKRQKKKTESRILQNKQQRKNRKEKDDKKEKKEAKEEATKEKEEKEEEKEEKEEKTEKEEKEDEEYEIEA